jgi:hypothetical protein
VSLKEEKKAIENMIIKIQRKYFESGEMPKNEYKSTLSKYQKRLGKIKKDVSLLSDKE